MRVLGYAADADETELREAGAEALLSAMAELPALLGLDG
jgi:hypothetical protein